MKSTDVAGTELRRGRPGAPRWLAGGALVVFAAVASWFGFGMDRGVLLSLNIRAKVWPWAPYVAEQPLRSQGLSDPVWQFVPWIELARRELAAGRLPLWNPHQDGGRPLLANPMTALASPTLLPALALGVERGWNLSLLVRVLLAASAMYAFLRRQAISVPASALGAVMVGWSGPFVAWLANPNSMTAAAAPLVLLAIDMVAREGRGRDVLALAGATALVVVGGHPETTVAVAALAVVWLAARAPSAAAACRCVTAAVLGALLAAPILVPFAEYLAHSEAGRGVGRADLVLPLSELLRFVWPGAPTATPVEGAATVSVVGLLLAGTGAVAARRDRRARALLAVAGGILAVSYANPLARAFAEATHAYGSRALIVLPVALGWLAATGLDRVLLSSGRDRPGRGRAALAWLATLVVAGELAVAAQGVHAVADPVEIRRSTPMLDVLAADREIFRILPLHTFLPPDSATLYGLDDVRGYDAMEPRAWRATRSGMGAFSRHRNVTDVLEPWDLAPGGAALDAWNVKYLLVHPQLDWNAETLNRSFGLDVEEVYSGPDGRLLRNRRVLPRARLDGDGEVVLVGRTPTRWRMEVAAAAPATLVLANPHFPGWSAVLDGRSVGEHPAWGAPWRVAVPAGRHVVEVRYRPASFRVGLVLAGVAAASLAFWTWWDARRGGPEARALFRR